MSQLEIDVEDLRKRLRTGDPLQVLDVRGRDAHEEWRIPGSRHLPWDEGSPANCSQLAREEPIVVVCASGNASLDAAREIRDRCGVEAYSLAGGMARWSFAWNAAEMTDPESDLSVVQLRRTGKGCLSYLVGSGDEAVAVDPALAPRVFRREAAGRGWEITAVLETHLHADHVSRGRALARAVDGEHFLPEGTGAEFDHRTLVDGETVPVGRAEVTALHTPGHTSAGISYRAGDFLFTGDTLFLDSVGRPDLEARGDREKARRHARLLHRSLSRLLALDDGVTVLPAHTSDPVAFDGEPVAAPLADVRGRIDAAAQDEEGFVRELVDGIPATPPNYERIVSLNERGVLPQDELADLEAGGNRCAVS